jgi:hypothetical protein
LLALPPTDFEPPLVLVVPPLPVKPPLLVPALPEAPPEPLFESEPLQATNSATTLASTIPLARRDIGESLSNKLRITGGSSQRIRIATCLPEVAFEYPTLLPFAELQLAGAFELCRQVVTKALIEYERQIAALIL